MDGPITKINLCLTIVEAKLRNGFDAIIMPHIAVRNSVALRHANVQSSTPSKATPRRSMAIRRFLDPDSCQRLGNGGEPVATTIVNVEEGLRGWLTQIHRAADGESEVIARRLHGSARGDGCT